VARKGTTLGSDRIRVHLSELQRQVTYSTKPGSGATLDWPVQPSVLKETGTLLGCAWSPRPVRLSVTKIPRVEAEFTYNQVRQNNYMFWVGGLCSDFGLRLGAGRSARSAGTAGIKAGMADCRSWSQATSARPAHGPAVLGARRERGQRYLTDDALL